MHKVDGQRTNAIRVTENRIHIGAGFFALFNLVIAGALIGTVAVVIFDLFQLIVIQHDLGGTAFIHNTDRDFVFYRLSHGVAVDNFTKHIQRGVNRCAGEAHEGGVGQ